jgi:hypothetical protein
MKKQMIEAECKALEAFNNIKITIADPVNTIQKPTQH